MSDPNEVIYQSADVRITPGGADFAGMTYAVRNITSVQMVTEPSQRGPAIFLAVLCAVGTVLGFMNDASTCAFVAIAVMVVCGVFAMMSNPKHHIRLHTAGGEIRAYTTENGDHAARISLALKNAITR